MGEERDVALAVTNGIQRVRNDYPASFKGISNANLKVLGEVFIEAWLGRELSRDE